jgi:hypothetical protein
MDQTSGYTSGKQTSDNPKTGVLGHSNQSFIFCFFMVRIYLSLLVAKHRDQTDVGNREENGDLHDVIKIWICVENTPIVVIRVSGTVKLQPC